MNDLTNVTTGEVRLSYVHLFKPYSPMPGQEEKYSTTILVPKSDVDTMNRINAAIETAKQKGITEKWNGVCPPMIPTPVYDGDGVRPSDGMAFGPECKGQWVFTASAKSDYPPEVVDANGNPIINQSEVYSGIYARVNVTFFPYAFGGKKGVGCGLGPVQKRRDGESLGGSALSASQAFGASPQQAVQPQFNQQQPHTQSQPQYNQQQAYGQPQQYAQPQFNQQQPHTQSQPQYNQQQAYGQPQQYAQQPTGINPITGLPY